MNKKSFNTEELIEFVQDAQFVDVSLGGRQVKVVKNDFLYRFVRFFDNEEYDLWEVKRLKAHNQNMIKLIS